ncbi:MAG: VOC family protein [Sphingobium phenoxybenzoativorans]
MSKMIFVNLPVSDLAKSIAFYEAVGAVADPHFRGPTEQMMTLSETIHVMLLTHERFNSFTTRAIPNAHETAQVLLCVSEESRECVDATVGRALAAGSKEPNPQQDHGFMYGRSFEDPDGHIWEVVWMDVEAALAAGSEAAA